MDCKAYEEAWARLAEGESISDAERHAADCPACGARLAALRRIVTAARLPQVSAPADLVARAQALMGSVRSPHPLRRVVAGLVGGGLAPTGARRTEATDFAVHLGAEGRSIRLHAAPIRGGWEIMGRAPGTEWTVVRDEIEIPCETAGRFKFQVPNLEASAFTLKSPDLEIEIPALNLLVDRGP